MIIPVVTMTVDLVVVMVNLANQVAEVSQVAVALANLEEADARVDPKARIVRETRADPKARNVRETRADQKASAATRADQKASAATRVDPKASAATMVDLKGKREASAERSTDTKIGSVWPRITSDCKKLKRTIASSTQTSSGHFEKTQKRAIK
jgi:predicted Zn-dependent protease